MKVMERRREERALTIILTAGLLLLHASAQGQMPAAGDRGYMNIPDGGGVAGEPRESQIARALAAGPSTITGAARVVGTDPQGKTIVLREGDNGFTCQPGNPNVIGRPASCSNEAARQWSADLAAGKPNPTSTEAGIIYMLAGATERSASGSTVTMGPQWIITWPFDPQTTGISATQKNTGAYILWPNTAYAHLHVNGLPVGTATEHLAAEHTGEMPAMGVHDGMADVGVPSNESPEVQIGRAISAGPKHVTDRARITGTDAQGATIVLREGDNGFVCRAGSLQVVAVPPACSSTQSRPTITYMLAGATQRSVTDPNDEVSPALAIAPHWMIMMRFNPKTTGIQEAYSDTGAYIMWSGARSGHMHINGAP